MSESKKNTSKKEKETEGKKSNNPEDNIVEYTQDIGKEWADNVVGAYQTLQRTANDMMNIRVSSQEQFFVVNRIIPKIGKALEDMSEVMIFINNIAQTQVLIDNGIIELKKKEDAEAEGEQA